MKLLSYDSETSIGETIHGPDFRDPNNDIYTQIWATDENWVGVAHNDGGWQRRIYKTVADEMFYADVIIGHNIGFDLCYVWTDPALQEFILKGGKIWDTQVAEYLLTGQQHAFSSLAELQLKYLRVIEKPSRISSLYKKRVGADKIVQARVRCPRLFTLYEQYCQTDGSTPIKIFKKQYALAKQEGMLTIIELYNDYLLAICNMTCTGINIDVIKCEKTLRDFNLKHLEYLQQAQDIVSKYWTDPRLPIFNINSTDHKSAVLFGGNVKVIEKQLIGYTKPKPIYEEENLGFIYEEYYDPYLDQYYTIEVPNIKRKKIGVTSGNPKYKNVESYVRVDGFRVPTDISRPAKKSGLFSTDDGVMIKIGNKTKNPLLKQYCEYQKEAMMYKKAAKTYCQAFLDRSINGILYANFNNTLTATGRLSSSNPNLQNVSKRNQFGKVLHSLFVAPPGWVCCQIDFSQLEIWVLAMLSNDSLLIQHLLDGIDLHIVRLQYYNLDKTYEELYKLCKEDKDPYWDKQRTLAKTVSYQMAYGAQPKKVAESTGLDLSIVELIFEKEKQTYPDAASFGDIVRQQAEALATVSLACNIPASQKRGKEGSRILGKVELLPVFDKDGNVSYTDEIIRRVGYYKSFLGQKWHFLDTGRDGKWGFKKSFSFTQPKNYPMQGTAATIQGATTAALLKALLNKQDRIRMINEVHDSKWFYVREDVLAPCLKWLKETIEDVPSIFLERFGITVPFKFPVDIDIGPNFGEMEKYND